ncbi:MAG: protein YgfX [Azovibrio sp.]|uniref:protein YgfX n=1 Tax=Azovibrio sp. TaxID=1872673 RepID=UPI003C72DF86
MQFPVFLKLHRSSSLRVLMLGIYGLAALGVLRVPWGWGLRLVCLTFLLGAGLLAWRQIQAMPDGLRLYQDGSLALERGGEVYPVTLLPGALGLPGLCVLRYRDERRGRAETLTLLPDSGEKESLRRLRLWLRLCAKVEPGA